MAPHDDQDHHDHHHHHDEPHRHPPQPDEEDNHSHFRLMEVAVRELLIEKGFFSAEDLRKEIEAWDARTPARGGQVVARAWTDPAFKARLLENGTAAVKELGMELGPMHLLVVENTPEVHNVVVCTLCSCYPRLLLGVPPDWYKSRAYRSRVVREPRKVLAEFGTNLPEDVQVRVHDSTADMRYMVLPLRPAGTEGWSEQRLAAIVNRDSLVGVTRLPQKVDPREPLAAE